MGDAAGLQARPFRRKFVGNVPVHEAAECCEASTSDMQTVESAPTCDRRRSDPRWRSEYLWDVGGCMPCLHWEILV